MTAAHAPGYPAAGPPSWRPGDQPVYRGGTGAIALLDSASGALGRLTHSRASTGTHVDGAGVMRSAAIDVPRFDWAFNGSIWVLRGLLREVQRQNKNTNFNAAPTDTTNVTKAGDAAATLTVFDDSAALTDAGLGTIGNGKAYKLDNAAGSANAFAVIGGAVGNTNAHCYSIYARNTGSGSSNARIGGSPPRGVNTISGASYVRYIAEDVTPAGTGSHLELRVVPGDVVYFILNQLEEGAYATSTILVAGAAATRAEDIVSTADLTWLQQPIDGRFDLVMTPMGAGDEGIAEILDISDGSFSDRVTLYQTSGQLQVNRKVQTGGVSQTDGGTVNQLVAGTESNVQLQVAQDDVQLAIDGQSSAAAGSVDMPSGLDRLFLFGRFDGTKANSGHIKSLTWSPYGRIAA